MVERQQMTDREREAMSVATGLLVSMFDALRLSAQLGDGFVEAMEQERGALSADKFGALVLAAGDITDRVADMLDELSEAGAVFGILPDPEDDDEDGDITASGSYGS